MNDFPPDAKPLGNATPWTGEGVNTPTEVGNSAVSAIGRYGVPAAVIGATELGGATLGSVAGPVGTAVGGAVGGGLGSVLAKHLPEEIGGNPNQSNTSAFLWGAVPTGLGSGLGALHALRVSGKLDEATVRLLDEHDAQIAKAAKQSREAIHAHLNPGPATAGDVADTLRQLGAKAQRYEAPADAVARREATFPLRDAVLGPINRMRKQYGEPLGQAYEALKGNQNRISEQDAAELADAATGVRDSLISPAPQAQAVINDLRRYKPKAPGSEAAPAMSDEDKLRALLQQHLATRAQGGAPQEITNDAIANFGKPAEDAAKVLKPPTLDRLRLLRQVVNQKLRTASGGDVHGLLNLQQALDNKLVDHLPDNWSELRQNYKSFSDQFKYQNLNQLRAAADPISVSKWLFGRPGKESFIREVVSHADPQERQMLQQGFNNFVLSSIDFSQPGEKQAAALSKKLQPYLANGTLRDLFGPQAANAVMDRIYLPIHAESLGRQLKTPAASQLFDRNFAFSLQTGSRQNPDLQRAVNQGFRAVIKAMPPEDQQAYMRMFHNPPKVDLGPDMQLPQPGVSPQDAMRSVLQGKLAQSSKNAAGDKLAVARGALQVGAGIGLGRLFGAPFVAARLLMLGGGAGNRALIKLATQTGTGDKLIQMLAAHPGEAGKYMYQFLAAVGSSVGQQQFVSKEPVDLGAAQ